MGRIGKSVKHPSQQHSNNRPAHSEYDKAQGMNCDLRSPVESSYWPPSAQVERKRSQQPKSEPIDAVKDKILPTRRTPTQRAEHILLHYRKQTQCGCNRRGHQPRILGKATGEACISCGCDRAHTPPCSGYLTSVWLDVNDATPRASANLPLTATFVPFPASFKNNVRMGGVRAVRQNGRYRRNTPTANRSSDPATAIPAQLMSKLILPCIAKIARDAVLTASSLLTSQTCLDKAGSQLTRVSRLSESTSISAMCAFRRASSSATARSMPLAAPVTAATVSDAIRILALVTFFRTTTRVTLPLDRFATLLRQVLKPRKRLQ